MNENEKSRRIMHVILDLLAAVDVDGDTELPEDWATPMTTDLMNLGAIGYTLSVEENDATVSIDVTPLLASAIGLLEVLVQDVSERAEQDRLAVINAVRQRVDETSEDD